MTLGSRFVHFLTGVQPSFQCTNLSQDEVYWTYLLVIPFSAATCITLKASYKTQWPFMLFTTVCGFIVQKLGQLMFSRDVATVLSAFMIGLLSNMYGRLSNDTALPCVLSGIMLLVPGAVGIAGFYQMMREQSSSTATGSTSFALDMIVRAMGIALGLYISTLVYFPMKKQKKRPEDKDDLLTL